MTRSHPATGRALMIVCAAPILYYVSIFPVVALLGYFYGGLAHLPGPLALAVSDFYYPWSVAAEAIPLLGQPLNWFEGLLPF